MEVVMDLIEDLLDKFEGGSPEDAEDAKNSLKNNKEQFIKNLTELANSGNEKAARLLERLKNAALD